LKLRSKKKHQESADDGVEGRIKCKSRGQKWVEAKEVTRPALTGRQVLVKTTNSGVCGMDVHYQHAGIGTGHEGAGGNKLQSLRSCCMGLGTF